MREFFVFYYFLIISFFFQEIILAQCRILFSPVSDAIDILSYWLARLIVAWSILLFVFVGYKFIKSEGNPDKIMEAKQTIAAILLGLGILFGTFELISIITGC